MRYPLFAVVATLALTGCVMDPNAPADDPPDHGVAIELAALNLTGVGDVVWDLQVDNGGGDVVWQRRISSSGYGDGAGSASYLGPCDAEPAVADNIVKVSVVGVYASAVNDAGSFASGADTGAGAVDGTPVAFQNPTTTAAPLTRGVTCQPNADVFAQFDVALMRPAQQGFFDVAVNFDDIFCSAKLHCCDDADSNGVCASDGSEDIALLFDASGARASTMVLGFACTAGPRDDVETELYMDPVELACTTNIGTFHITDFTIDPSGAPGNQCTAGADGMSSCTDVIAEVNGVDADTFLYQIGVYRGVEQLTSGGQGARKAYWNLALGVKRPAIASCWLQAQATVDDAADSPAIADGTIGAGVVYPVVHWNVDLAACTAEELTFGAGVSEGVFTAYTGTAGDARSFTYGFGPGFPAGTFCDPICDNGGTCIYGACDCPEGYSGAACEVAPFDEQTLFTLNTTWQVPAGVTAIRVKAWGAGGGGGGTSQDYGGGGGFAQADLAVTPGETLYVQVGGGGGRASSPSGGTNGGGQGGNSGLGATAGGGGYSGVFRTSVSQANALVVAGGGGGGGHRSTANVYQHGGGGGGGDGTNGGPNSGGGAGTESAGGSGYNAGGPLAGGAGAGGDGSHYSIGGGGGGYFGGGSGNGFGTGGGTAGGGGSGFVSGTNTIQLAGQGYGDASPGTPANATDPDRAGPRGVGGAGNTDGGGGYVVIRY